MHLWPEAKIKWVFGRLECVDDVDSLRQCDVDDDDDDAMRILFS